MYIYNIAAGLVKPYFRFQFFREPLGPASPVFSLAGLLDSQPAMHILLSINDVYTVYRFIMSAVRVFELNNAGGECHEHGS